jgi:hypothetical protein
MKWQGWIITSDWYDEMEKGHFAGNVCRTRADAIDEFMQNFPDHRSWRSLKRIGWRCIKCTVSWQ